MARRRPLILSQIPLFLVWLLLFLGSGSRCWAVLPISHYHDLVAGEGARGFRDGSFDSALFDFPQGLAIDKAGKKLFVADRNNHRIRVVDLDRSNRVTTLAGTGKRDYINGSLGSAAFDHPTALALIGDGLLAVYDSGNRRLRLIDLRRKTVAWLAGSGNGGCLDGDKGTATLEGVWAMAYEPEEGALYFTQPAYGALRKLDLKRGSISTLFARDPRIPRPRAICRGENGLYVAGEGPNQTIYWFRPAGTRTVPVLESVGKGSKVLALVSSAASLYAVQSGTSQPWLRILPPQPPGGVFGIRAVWGGTIQYVRDQYDSFLNSGMDDQVGVVADPRNPKRFLLSSGPVGAVLSLKDYSFNKLIHGYSSNSEGLHDFEYPLPKPSGTFRILVVGNSYIFYQTRQDGIRWGWKGGDSYGNRMESMPKRLELMLNTQASLEDVPRHFEVLNLSEPASDRPAFLWLCHEAPRIVEEYDVDLVVYFFVSSADDLERNLAIYARRPLSNEGLPEMEMDPEYLLRPWEQKIPKGLPGEFYRYAMAKGLIQPGSKTELSFADPLRFLEDPRARGYMGSLSAVPLRTFQEKIKDIGDRQGRRIGFCSCFLPVRDCEPSAFHMDNLELIRSFWRGVAKRGKVPFLDLTPSFTALERTYWPLDEATANRHFDGNGHWFFAYILEHALIDQGLVPYETSIHRKKGTAKTLSP